MLILLALLACSPDSEDADPIDVEDEEEEPCEPTVYFQDDDGDGFGTEQTMELCQAEDGWADNADDCDDTNAAANPGELEIPCDGVDQDCDGDDPQGVAFLGEINYPTLQQAFDASGDGDTLLVCPGDHELAAERWGAVDLTIRSAAEDADTTRIVAPEGANQLIDLMGSSGVTLAHLTFSGSSSFFWPTVELGGSDGRIIDCHFEAIDGDALKLQADADATMTVEGARFTDTLDVAIDTHGDGHIVFDDLTVTGSQSEVLQIGINLASIVVSNSTFENNGGGGAVIRDRGACPSITVEGTTFRGNTNDYGVFYMWRSFSDDPFDLVLEDNVIEDNSTGYGGNVIQLRTSGADTPSTVLWQGGTFLRNTSVDDAAFSVYPHSDEISVDIVAVDLGSGVDDNNPSDVGFNSDDYSWDGVTTVTCVGGDICD